MTGWQDVNYNSVGYIIVHKGVLEHLFSDAKFAEIVDGLAEATALKRELAATCMIGKTKGTSWARNVVKRPVGLQVSWRWPADRLTDYRESPIRPAFELPSHHAVATMAMPFSWAFCMHSWQFFSPTLSGNG